MDPLPPELPPRAPLDDPDGRILGGGGASLGTPFAETPEATGEEWMSVEPRQGRVKKKSETVNSTFFFFSLLFSSLFQVLSCSLM